MDTPSHGLWSYVLWHATPFPFLAVFLGIFPDVVAMGPSCVYSAFRGKFSTSCTTHPRWLRTYRTYAFLYTHSLIIGCAVFFVVAIQFGWQWWLLAWHLHIVVDIFSHPKEKATPFLWPFFGTQVNGVRWWSKKFIGINALLLGGVWLRFLR